MNLNQLFYVPTLAIRPSEMSGLEMLPGPSKDRLSPTFLLAPWVASNGLDKSIERLQKAFPHRPYFLDFDRDYQFSNTGAQSQRELQLLLSSADSYGNWTNFIAQYPFINPCIQCKGLDGAQIIKQVERVQRLGRRFCIRHEVTGERTGKLSEIVSAISRIGTADYAILIEDGWKTDALTRSATISGIVRTALASIEASVPIIISCTTIPRMFTEIKGTKIIPFTNRNLVKEVARNNNFRTIVYGDWGSTRPREYTTARTPPPRIDYPTRHAWIFARNKEKNWGFADAARAIMATDSWQESYGLGIWGEQMIERTSTNPAIGISTPQKNVASRINIHLHQQAFYDVEDITTIDLDEEWED